MEKSEGFEEEILSRINQVIPASQAVASGGDLPKAVASGGRETGEVVAKVLLVEDNQMNRDMLSRRLIKKGYDVVTAGKGSTWR